MYNQKHSYLRSFAPLWYYENTKRYFTYKGCSVMSSPNYTAKTRAIAELQSKTGKGRRVIENVMDDLQAKGLIIIEPDPYDKRIQRIRATDVELVLRVLMGEDV